MNGRIIYARGFPYGAPLVMVRGGATRAPEIKQFLKDEGFRWDGQLHAWTTYRWADEFRSVLKRLRDDFGCEVMPKDNLDANYILDLEVQ